MKVILEYIEQQKQIFSSLPFFDFLRDGTIAPLQKLAFAPCTAPFVMGFSELNRSVFREEGSTDRLQKIINHHSHQDAHHWVWFLEDLEKLGLNSSASFREVLCSLWSDEVAAARQLIYELYRLTHQHSPLQKLVVIEAIEATGNVFLEESIPFVRALEAENQEQYRYFGSHHLTVETGHTYASADAQDFIANLEVAEADRWEQLQVVDCVFQAFTAFTHAMLAYAQNHPIETEPQLQLSGLSSCLYEAGLITLAQLEQARLEQQFQHQSIGDIVVQQGWVTQQTVDYFMTHMIQRQPMSTSQPLVFSN